MIIYALRTLSLPDPSRVLYVGDTDSDIIAARLFVFPVSFFIAYHSCRAGCRTCIVPYARNTESMKESPDYYLKDINDLTTLIPLSS